MRKDEKQCILYNNNNCNTSIILYISVIIHQYIQCMLLPEEIVLINAKMFFQRCVVAELG